MTDESLHVLQAGHEGSSARNLFRTDLSCSLFITFKTQVCCFHPFSSFLCSLLSHYYGALFPHNKASLFLKGLLMWKINVKRCYPLNVCNKRKASEKLTSCRPLAALPPCVSKRNYTWITASIR